jgi:hypothetical protein
MGSYEYAAFDELDCRISYPAYKSTMPGATEHAQNDNKGECCGREMDAFC